jgi:hypothetical protein
MARLAPASLLAAAALAAGCGSAVGTTSAPPDAPAAPRAVHHQAVPDGFRRHTVREAGISVALPIGFQVLGQRDAVFPGVYANLTKLDASFKGPIAALASPDSPLKLFAFDRVFWHKHSTTAMVVQATYGRPGTTSWWMGKMRRSLARAAGRVGPLHVAKVPLPTGPGLRAEYRTSAGDTQIVYLVASRDAVWALMFRTPTATAAARRHLFAQAARTIEFAAPVGGLQRRGPTGPTA